MGRLYLVGTPIGNLEDITLRALRILREVTLIAAEDTRTTRKLLNAYDIRTPLTSFYEHSGAGKLDRVLQALESGDVALVAEAGMPAISDPGYELVKAAIDRGIRIEPIPGPSAVLSALAVSGLPTDQFVYLGFLPRRPADRRRRLEAVKEERRTMVAFESPHRLRSALEDMQQVLGDRPIAVCRELTKLHEEVVRGTIATALEYFVAPRGEFTLVIGGKPKEESSTPTEAMVENRLHELLENGMPPKRAIAQTATEFRLPKRQVYSLWLERERKS